MLLSMCSVIDHRWCKNVIKTKKLYIRHSHVLLMFLPHSDVFCDLLLKRNTTWNLFVLHNKANIFLSYSDCIYLLPFNGSKERNNQYVQIVQLLMKISFQIYFWRTCAFFEIYWIKKTPSVLSIWSIQIA